MGQLGLFTRAELAGMRDRTKSRRYSPEKEAFRREHERRRGFGLVQRHSRKLRELHGGDGIVALTAAMLHRADPSRDPGPAKQASPPVVEPPSRAQIEPPVAQVERPGAPSELLLAQVELPSRAQIEPPVAQVERPGTPPELLLAQVERPGAPPKSPVVLARPSGGRVSGAAPSEPGAAVPAPSPVAAGRAGVVPANADRVTTRAPIRRRVCHFGRGVFRRRASTETTPNARCLKSISCALWKVRVGWHPP